MTGKRFNLALLDNQSAGINPVMKYQSLTLSALGLFSILAAGNLYASDLCDVAKADRQPVEALQSKDVYPGCVLG